MKKLIFMLLATVLFSIAISSCTEEVVNPKNEDNCDTCGNGGGGVSDFPPH